MIKMKKYYLILFLFIALGCGNSPSSENKKAVLSEKQAIENSEMNRKVVKDKIPKSKKISSKRSKNKIVNNRQSKKIKKKLNNSNKPSPGQKIKAPDFLLADLEGNIIDLSAYSGQVIMLTFWGTWCGPCRREIPDFIKLYDEFNADGLEIVGVAVQSGTPDNIKRFTDYYKINYPILTDIDGRESAKTFYDYGRVTGVGTRAVPTTFIIDRDGYIVKTYRGARPGSVFYRDLKPYL